jgi:hypothetical protein
MVSLVLMFAGSFYVHNNCFHQIGMIAFIKLRHPRLFAARIACNRGTCVCLFLFLSKNENNNGFDTIGLNSSLFDYRRVANILFIDVSRIGSSGCLF